MARSNWLTAAGLSRRAALPADSTSASLAPTCSPRVRRANWANFLSLLVSMGGSDLHAVASLDLLQPGFALLVQVVVELGLGGQPRFGVADLDGAGGHDFGLRGRRLGWGRASGGVGVTSGLLGILAIAGGSGRWSCRLGPLLQLHQQLRV